MKKITYIFVFLLSIFYGQTAQADIAPMNAHQVETCVIIKNNLAYENIFLFSRITPPGGIAFTNLDTYKPIEFDTCLARVYKLSGYSIWWNDQNDTSNARLLSDAISPNNVWVALNDVLLQQTITYSLEKDTSGDLFLKHISTEKSPATYIQYLLPLILTILVELCIALVSLRILKKAKGRFLKITLILVVLNVITFTPFWLVTSSAGAHITNIVVFGEIIIILTEAIGYALLLQIPIKSGLIMSLVLNVCSIIAGLFTYPIAAWLFN